MTVVYVTHDQSEALAVSDQIVVMRNAEIAQAGSPRELYEAARERVRRDLHGRGEPREGPPERCVRDRRDLVRLDALAIRLSHKGLSTARSTS